jgi:hypothetical protein
VQGGFGPRFALEAGFLIALAIAAGAAQLSATTIVVVMAVAWLLVCLFELAVWVEGPRFPTWRRERVVVDEPQETVPAPEPVEAESEPVAAAVDSRDGGEGR